MKASARHQVTASVLYFAVIILTQKEENASVASAKMLGMIIITPEEENASARARDIFRGITHYII